MRHQLLAIGTQTRALIGLSDHCCVFNAAFLVPGFMVRVVVEAIIPGVCEWMLGADGCCYTGLEVGFSCVFHDHS